MNLGCNSILPLIILMSCCNKGGIGELFGGSRGELDDLLWLLCILCLCGNNKGPVKSLGSSDERKESKSASPVRRRHRRR